MVLFDALKMPHSPFKHRPTWVDVRVVKCPCSQTFNYKSERDKDMKLQMHRKFCDKWPGPTVAGQQGKAMIPKKCQHMIGKRREFDV